MKATQMPQGDDRLPEQFLYISFELGKNAWVLALSNGQKMRFATIPARDLKAVDKETASAIEKFSLPNDVPIVSCYEAGRDGFWLHRVLVNRGIENIVVDSSSIEVNRKARRNKTDHLDAGSLVRMLYRYKNGESKVWSIVHVPLPEVEDERRIHRELDRLKKERSAHTARIKTLLFGQGIVVSTIKTTPGWLEKHLTGGGLPLSHWFMKELNRELTRLELVRKQIKEIEYEQIRILKEKRSVAAQKASKLLQLKGVGTVSSWNLLYEFFWRSFHNRKQVASAAGLTPSVYQSGKMDRDLGISKAGNKRVRSLMVELSWLWLRYQPESALSKWFNERFQKGSKRIRKVGIVALARKLLVALWHYLEKDIVPQGACLKA